MTRGLTPHPMELPALERTTRRTPDVENAGNRPRARGRLGLAALLALCPIAQGCGAPESLRPNLVLITVDTLRTDRLACYGGPDAGGTALCDLADSGTRYTWAISPSPSTRVAIASLFTSRYPSRHGVTAAAWSALPSKAVTLAEVLRAGGYATGAFVGSASLNRSSNLQQGFDIYDDWQPRSPATPRDEATRRPAASLTGAAIGFAQQVAEPWFIWIHYGEPGEPGEPGELHELTETGLARGLHPPLTRNRSAALERLRGYDAAIRLIDHQIGRLIDGLDALGRPGVVVTADHGQALGEDGFWFEHGHSVALDQIRVPLVWRPPHELDASRADHRGRVHSEPVSTLDVAATLLAAARLQRPEGFAGVPLGSLAMTADASARAIFAEHPQQAAVVSKGFYYARDRRTLAEAVGPSNRLADRLADRLGVRDEGRQSLPPRFAQLNKDGTRTPYRPFRLGGSAPSNQSSERLGASETGAKVALLEAMLSEFLAENRDATDETRE